LKKLGNCKYGTEQKAVQPIVMDHINSCGWQNAFKSNKPEIEWMYVYNKDMRKVTITATQ